MKRQTFGTYSALEDGQWGTGFNFKLALYLLIVLCLALPLSTRRAVAQSAFGSITGTVTDAQGSVIPSAKVTATDESTGVSQTTQTNDSGDFVFPSLLPATYTVTAEKEGFKKLGKTGLALVAAQRLSAGTFQLAVGQATITVTVNAEGVPIETSSSEISSTISTAELAKLPSMGLDYMALTTVLPGSNYTGWGVTSGGWLGSSSVSFNGLTGSGTGNGTYVSTNGVYSSSVEDSSDSNPPDMDNIEDIHVLASNYEAQYGRTTGTVINVTTKSGTSQFHGDTYYYFRDASLNANDFFAIRTDQPRAPYHYNTFGGAVGGPVLVPGWADSRKKLFFFLAASYAPQTTPAGPRYYLVPTEQEREGNFSQSYFPGTSGTVPVIVKDPLTQQPFPGNIVPQSFINSTMQKVFNEVFPMPNFFNDAVSYGGYNYVINDSATTPTDRESLRLDYAATSKARLFGRYQRVVTSTTGRNNQSGILAGWQQGTEKFYMYWQRFELGGTYAITPRLFNQASGGWMSGGQTVHPSSSELSQFQTTALGVNFPNPYPNLNPLNLLPAMIFNWGPTFDYEPRFPLYEHDHAWSGNDDLTYVKGNHQFKFGAYVDAATSYQPHHTGMWGMDGSGEFQFMAPNPANPHDVGDPLAEALMGNFDSYLYATNRVVLMMIQREFEWYAQDNWKVTKKLSLNYGARFVADIPVKNGNQYGASIDFSQYNPADAAPLYQPVMVGGTRMMRNPVTGALASASYEGLFVPGVGSPDPGSIPMGNKYLADSRGVLVSPRFGFAYDPFADGKTVIRGGFSKSMSQRTQWGHVYGNVMNPPSVFYPTQYYGNIGDVTTQPGLLGPSSVQYMDPHGKLPYSLQWSLGVQREVGYKTVAGLSYVGNVSRHGEYGFNINEVPYGSQFLPQNQDPTYPNSQIPSQGTPLPPVYYAPYPGYGAGLNTGAINYVAFGDNGNDNSLQATLERRFAHNLTFAAAYTWSRILDDRKGNTYIPVSMTYGPSMGQEHRLTTDWVWEVPKGSRYWNNWLSRAVLDNWSFSGIASFITGPPMMAGCGTTYAINITGGGDGSQCIINAPNAILPRSKRSFNQFFNTSVFSLPTPITVQGGGRTPYTAPWTTANVGNQWNPSFYGPGINNWDLSVMKDLPVIKERFTAQLRLDMFNAFNHPSFNGVNSGLTFDQTGQQVGTAVGALNSDMGPRVMQLSLRLKF